MISKDRYQYILAGLVCMSATYFMATAITAGAASPPDQPQVQPQRFVQVAAPDGGVIRGRDGVPIVVDLQSLYAQDTKGDPVVVTLWQVLDGVRDQSDADLRIAAATDAIRAGRADDISGLSEPLVTMTGEASQVGG